MELIFTKTSEKAFVFLIVVQRLSSSNKNRMNKVLQTSVAVDRSHIQLLYLILRWRFNIARS